jgi:hypothetical protein
MLGKIGQVVLAMSLSIWLGWGCRFPWLAYAEMMIIHERCDRAWKLRVFVGM